MNLIDLALHIPNFVPTEICDECIKFYESQPSEDKYFENSTSTETTEQKFLSGLCLEILPQHSIYEHIHKFTGLGIEKWLEHIHSFGCFSTHTLGATTDTSHKYRIIKYSKDMFIHNHTDVGNTDLVGMTIRGSCTLNFSDVNDYKDGEFNVFNGKHKFKLGKGDLMIFPADAFWVHGTYPVTSGTRYAVNSFLHPNLSP